MQHRDEALEIKQAKFDELILPQDNKSGIIIYYYFIQDSPFLTQDNLNIKDRRGETIEEPIPEELLLKGKTQLEAEIDIIEGWLSDLDETREDNPESILARTTYTNMLLNRRELLNTLKQK